MKSSHFFILLIVVVIGVLVLVRNYSDGARADRTTIYDGFAQCLTDAGAVFYGAYWCPHCNDQKQAFDNSSFIPYVECSTPGGQGQTKECSDAGITGYPTWHFADGSELSGNVPLPDLAEKTGCKLPSEPTS